MDQRGDHAVLLVEQAHFVDQGRVGVADELAADDVQEDVPLSGITFEVDDNLVPVVGEVAVGGRVGDGILAAATRTVLEAHVVHVVPAGVEDGSVLVDDGDLACAQQGAEDELARLRQGQAVAGDDLRKRRIGLQGLAVAVQGLGEADADVVHGDGQLVVEVVPRQLVAVDVDEDRHRKDGDDTGQDDREDNPGEEARRGPSSGQSASTGLRRRRRRARRRCRALRRLRRWQDCRL